MQSFQFLSRKKILQKVFLIILFTVVFIILFSSFIYYYSFRNTQINIMYNFSNDSLEKLDNTIGYMFDSVYSTISMFHNDSDINYLLYYNNLYIGEVVKAFTKINSFSISQSYIHSIYIYNGSEDKFYTNLPTQGIKKSDVFLDQEIIKVMEENKYSNQVVFNRRTIKTLQKYSECDVFSFINIDASKKTGHINNAIIINVNKSWIEKNLTSRKGSSIHKTIILDYDGEIIGSSANEELHLTLNDPEIKKIILASTEGKGNFIEKIKNTKYLISYLYSPKTKWYFVDITPYDYLITETNKTAIKVLIICFALLLVVGLSAVYFSARKIYSPINEIIYKLNLANIKNRENSYTIKQNYLKSLILNENIPESKDYVAEFTNSNIAFDPLRSIVLIMLQIDNFDNFCNTYNFEDRNTLKYGIMNIASELFTKSFVNDTIDIDDDIMLVILNVSSPLPDEEHQKMRKAVLDTQSCTKKFLSVSLSATIGMIGEGIKDIHKLYQLLYTRSHNRIFLGHNCVIYSQSINMHSFSEYSYDFSKEKHMIDELMLEKMDNVKKVFTDIINSTNGYVNTVLNSVLLRLTYSTIMAVDSIEDKGTAMISYNFDSFMNKLSSLETINQIQEHFFNMFDYISLKLNESRNKKHDQLISKVISIIETEYPDSNLYLSSISNSVKMSPTYLGRLFKKHTMQSVSEYIHDVRIQKAVHLLTTTDKPISNISSSVGFVRSNYFYTVFKKKYGVTPNEFRKNYADNPDIKKD